MCMYMCLYIYVCIRVCMCVCVWFYGISIIVGYLMPNPVFKYILDIWFLNTVCKYTQLNHQNFIFNNSI